jgi:nitrate reductase delta subunit
VKLAEEVTSPAESLGVDGFAEFFKEATATDLEGHRVELFELPPRCPPYGGYHALGEDDKERGGICTKYSPTTRPLGLS